MYIVVYIYIYMYIYIYVCVCVLNVHYMHMFKSTHCPHPRIGSAVLIDLVKTYS